eukprot:jgi/Botrbrau1/8543/Bobra.0359s0007.2
MAAGIDIVTPNKRFGSGPATRYMDVMGLVQQRRARFLAEASVGAGLPVLSTLQSLLLTGDRIHRIEGIFSGTLSFIFNNFGKGQPFSDIVAKARELGYTEPDPRDDLSGTDVARKVVILARMCGVQASECVELGDVAVDSLVPAALRSAATAEAFLSGLQQFDGDMAQQAKDAAANGAALRYIGCYDASTGACSVGLKAFPKSHPFCQLSGSDNIISFTTDRYQEQPLIVRGPGAGAQVTAAGVFSDILQIARYHGAHI